MENKSPKQGILVVAHAVKLKQFLMSPQKTLETQFTRLVTTTLNPDIDRPQIGWLRFLGILSNEVPGFIPVGKSPLVGLRDRP